MEIFLGVIVLTIPILLYFVYHNAVRELFTAYFYNNIFLYHKSSNSIFYNVGNNLMEWTVANPLVAGMILVSVIFIFTRNKAIICWMGCTFGFTSLFVLFVDYVFYYYSFILGVFAVFGFIVLGELFNRFFANKIYKPIWIFISTALSLIVCLWHSPNTKYILSSKQETPQYQFKAYIEQKKNYSGGGKDTTLLNYGFLDGGFYTVCNIVPSCKYFCELTIQLEEMFVEQDKCLENGDVDYVVTRKQKIDFDQYQLVATASYEDWGIMYDYYLYEKVSNY
jgi:hypothetical protein